jgi:hypothetical protein
MVGAHNPGSVTKPDGTFTACGVAPSVVNNAILVKIVKFTGDGIISSSYAITAKIGTHQTKSLAVVHFVCEAI